MYKMKINSMDEDQESVPSKGLNWIFTLPIHIHTYIDTQTNTYKTNTPPPTN